MVILPHLMRGGDEIVAGIRFKAHMGSIIKAKVSNYVKDVAICF